VASRTVTVELAAVPFVPDTFVFSSLHWDLDSNQVTQLVNHKPSIDASLV
jgi:hypothetical protein